jgi:membrane fusion protein (multidrug efflux system)
VARQQLDIAAATLGRTEGELGRLAGVLARAELDLSYAEITAPFAGVVGLTAFDPGALVGPESGPLVTLTQLDPMRVEFQTPTATMLDFREGGGARDDLRVELVLPNGRRYDRAGRIDFVDTVVGRTTDTVTVRAVFENPDYALPDGALVTVELVGDAPELVLSVPRRAVQRDQVGPFVLVVGPDNRVEQRRVQIARATRDISVIAGGLAEGELVITEGLNAVRPGIEVDAAPAGG